MTTERENSVKPRQQGILYPVLISLLLFAGIVQAGEAGEAFRSFAPFAIAGSDFSSSGGVAYQPMTLAFDWSGEIVQRRYDSAGHRQGDGWSARAAFDEMAGDTTDYWKDRPIFTTDSYGRQIAFLWNRLTEKQRQALEPESAESQDPYGSSVLNYLRGDRSRESWTGFRHRSNLLGDIRHSLPVLTDPPARPGRLPPYDTPGYHDYFVKYAERPALLHIGANDGMLHSFDAETGRELFAYVPGMVDFGDLATLVQHGYRHNSFVDGALVSADVKTDSGWRRLLAGGLGNGGRGLFVLDITDVGIDQEALERVIHAELDGADEDMGRIGGRLTFAILEDGNWYLVTGNGSHSASGRGVLYLLPLATRESLQDAVRISVPKAAAGGLSPPALIDSDGNGRADTAYAGDLAGNLWKFDLDRLTVEAAPLFKAGRGRSIRSQPEVAAHPAGGYMVFVATQGIPAETAEPAARQVVVALHDRPGRKGIITIDRLKNLSAALKQETEHGRRFRVIQQSGEAVTNGWLLELPLDGEAVLERPRLHAGRLRFVSTYSDPAITDGAPGNWYMELDWLTGGSNGEPFGDFNGDGRLDHADGLLRNGRRFYPVGEDIGNGAFSEIGVVRLAGGMDAVMINGIDVKRNKGLAGGNHLDLDSYDGSAALHTEAYDKLEPADASVDFLNLKGGQARLFPEAPGLFLVLLANADLSPAGDILIATAEREKVWSLTAYQQLVQRLLSSYVPGSDPARHFVDETGFPLLFTRDQSSGSGYLRKLKLRFDPHAVQKGGLHATLPQCVKRGREPAKGRLRNGALMLQFFSAVYLDDENALLMQHPEDLAPYAEGYGGVYINPSLPGALRYESAIYWHYPGSACYGDPGWAGSLLKQAGLLTPAVIHSLLANTSDFTAGTLARIAELLDRLSELVCDKGSEFDCDDEQQYLEIIDELAELLDVELFEELVRESGKSLDALLMNLPAALLSDDNRSRILKPKRPARAKHVDRRRSWIDLEQ